MKLLLVDSRPFGRICYGYIRDKQGLIEIVLEEAEAVRTVFKLYRQGLEQLGSHSELFILYPLEKHNGAVMS